MATDAAASSAPARCASGFRTGRAEVPDWDCYVALDFFRLAAIFHGIRGHVARGTATSAHARERAAAFPRLVAPGVQAMAACR